jgi:hypothetical protein
MRVLVVVLWRQRVPHIVRDFESADLATVDAGVGRPVARTVQVIVGVPSGSGELQVVDVFVLCYRELKGVVLTPLGQGRPEPFLVGSTRV